MLLMARVLCTSFLILFVGLPIKQVKAARNEAAAAVAAPAAAQPATWVGRPAYWTNTDRLKAAVTKVTDPEVLAGFRRMLSSTAYRAPKTGYINEKTGLFTNYDVGYTGTHPDKKKYGDLTIDCDGCGVFRIEDPVLFRLYQARKSFIKRRIRATEGPTDRGASEGNRLAHYIGRELDGDANEHYLFTGTKPEYVNNIVATGMDLRFSSLTGMFGSGNYFADRSSKADQYSAPMPSKTNVFPMLVARVTLGNSVGTNAKPFTLSHGAMMKRDRAVHKGRAGKTTQDFVRKADDWVRLGFVKPVKNRSRTSEVKPFHSVIAIDTGTQTAAEKTREYIVYRDSQVYVEYIIYYSRVAGQKVARLNKFLDGDGA